MTADTDEGLQTENAWKRTDSENETGQADRSRSTRRASGSLFQYPGGAAQNLLVLPLRTIRGRTRESHLIRCLDKLDSAFYEVLAPIFDEAPELKTRFRQWILDASWLAAQALTGDPAAEDSDSAMLDRVVDEGTTLATELKSNSTDSSLVSALDEVVQLGQDLRGTVPGDLINRLTTMRPPHEPVVIEGGFGTEHISDHVAGSAFGTAGVRIVNSPFRNLDQALDVGSLLDESLRREKAEKQIKRKAAAIGAGAALGSLKSAGSGYVIRYADYTIYFSEKTGAHSVEGDILAKYKAAHAVSDIGLPTTDETSTPDGIGRYNHFETGSIYWTPDTGPMIVSGLVAARWASAGWENSPLGYPVADTYHIPGLYPSDNPTVAWSLFQNGAVVTDDGGVREAITADLSPAQLRVMIRRFIDDGLHRAGQSLGLQPQIETVEVSSWSYGFWAASPRTVTFALHGFRDNGLLPDTDFDITIRLRFSLVWLPAFTAPSSKTLIAALDWHKVNASGIASNDIATGVYNGIAASFWRGGPAPGHPEVPDGAVFIDNVATGISQTGNGNVDVVDVLTTQQGGLQVLVNPLPPKFGELRRQQAKRTIDGLIG